LDYWAFLQKNLFLVAITVVSGGMLIWPLLTRLFNPGKGISAQQLVHLINRRDAVIVDVGEAAEYAAGHIPNARHIPLAQLDARVKELERYKNRPIVLTCRTGSRCAGASATLHKHGFGEVFSLSGGVGAWEQATMPVEKGEGK